jgi:hypothetical protein
MAIIFSLVYTTRRPAMVATVLQNWLNKATKPAEVEMVIAIDGNDMVSLALMRAAKDSSKIRWVVQDQPPFNSVRGWNKAAERATGKVLLIISDDFDCPPAWDQKLLELPVKNWVDGEYVVHVDDGFVQDLCTLPILTRKRYQRFGYVFYSSYESVFSDTELTERARMDGVMIEAVHLRFEHHHYDNHKRELDAIDREHNSTGRWKRGQLLFDFRKSIGFPADIQAKVQEVYDDYADYAAYVQCTKDDFCLFEVCKRAYEEGLSHFFFCIPDEYWSGRPTPPEDVAEVQAVAARLKAELLGVKTKVVWLHVADFREAGRSRIDVETLVRNASLKVIAEAGFKHIIILDGDELWVPGLLAKVSETVDRCDPMAVGCRMVPVVGLPGYPIDEALDTITVYIRAGERFGNCRSPAGQTLWLGDYGVIHFTACRKTMEEIIRKHRDSGHGDDPDYDMEGWIANVLPYVRPSMENVHMYKRYQIWPRVRNWTIEELSYIPTTIWPYIGIDHVLEPRRALKLTANMLARQLNAVSKVCHMASSTVVVHRGQTVKHR